MPSCPRATDSDIHVTQPFLPNNVFEISDLGTGLSPTEETVAQGLLLFLIKLDKIFCYWVSRSQGNTGSNDSGVRYKWKHCKNQALRVLGGSGALSMVISLAVSVDPSPAALVLCGITLEMLIPVWPTVTELESPGSSLANG